MKKFNFLAVFFVVSNPAWAVKKSVSAPFPALPKTAPSPKSNPSTPEKISLGMMLFMDQRLSFDGSSSCNSCHNIMAGGDDQRDVSVGINGQKGTRSAPSVWNSAFLSVKFWDGRAASLEDQALRPLTNPIEMGNPNLEHVISKLNKIPGYVSAFQKAFGGKNPVNKDNMAMAIASFERTLVTTDSPYDLYAKGIKKALSPQAQRGLQLVQDVGCTSCHSGPVFAGPQLPEGTGFFQKFPVYPNETYETKYQLSKDLGRFNVTKKEEDKNMWRVPTWRNVSLTAPYFHNGSVPSLKEAVRVMAKTQLNRDLPDNDVLAIVAFLDSLTGKFPSLMMPRLP